MQVLRTASRYIGTPNESDLDVVIEDALLTALKMMYEDDGKNSRQLVEWARLPPLLSSIVRRRLYEGSELNHNWAIQNRLNSYAVWLMWMTMSDQSLKMFSSNERKELHAALSPMAFFPLRYPAAEAPPNYFHLPFIDPEPPLYFMVTAHGDYPVFPPNPENRIFSDVHYSSRPTFAYPLVAPAARLLHFAFSSLVTRSSFDEINWGLTIRLPLGPGLIRENLASNTNSNGSRDENMWRYDWGDDDSVAGMQETVLWTGGAQPLNLPWSGKAPHTCSSLAGPCAAVPKSRRWDADWWRSRTTGDPMRPVTSVPYGSVYEPGCMDGLWQGRLQLPDQQVFSKMMKISQRFNNFAHSSLATIDFFVDLREAYSVVGMDHGDDIGAGDLFDDNELGLRDNMNNAWLLGSTESTSFRFREVKHGAEELEIVVEDELGNRRVGKFPCWRRSQGWTDSMGRGNEGVEDLVSGASRERLWEAGLEGFPHDPFQCDECQARQRVQRHLIEKNREAKAELRAGSLPSGSEMGSDNNEESDGDVSMASYDASVYEMDASHEAITDPEGNFYPPLPPAHDPLKLAEDQCTGIRNVFLAGETSERHAREFGYCQYYGRVRPWDGMISLIQRPSTPSLPTMMLYGYLVGGENFVGSARISSIDPRLPSWEGNFVMSRRRD